MFKYRKNLPQLNGDMFLMEGGPETTLIFKYGLDLPEFAAFDLYKNDEGCEHLRNYYSSYGELVEKYNVNFIFESVTFRASSDWGEKLGYSREALGNANRKAIKVLLEMRNRFETEKNKIVICGSIGPRIDGYIPGEMMSEKEAEKYHFAQLKIFSETDADFVTACTLTNTEEAIGVCHAAKSLNMPVVISFAVETDGNLDCGLTLKEAIEKTDKATDNLPLYYMINCAHPTHFEGILVSGEPWLERIRGIRANASTRSHAEMEAADDFDEGNPEEFGQQYKALKERLPHLNILGGCCGSDQRHIEEIYKACMV
ncbi:MAG: homocysteine S-methyltransferase family protein [Desulfobacterales bacterium]|nr:homocysteine S-methyltransferase family protein [Desulfobacterales bacterium]